MEKSVQPVINHYWTREEFPYELMWRFATSASWARTTRASAAPVETSCWTA